MDEINRPRRIAAGIMVGRSEKIYGTIADWFEPDPDIPDLELMCSICKTTTVTDEVPRFSKAGEYVAPSMHDVCYCEHGRGRLFIPVDENVRWISDKRAKGLAGKWDLAKKHTRTDTITGLLKAGESSYAELQESEETYTNDSHRLKSTNNTTDDEGSSFSKRTLVDYFGDDEKDSEDTPSPSKQARVEREWQDDMSRS
jgi:hypothetical protein